MQRLGVRRELGIISCLLILLSACAAPLPEVTEQPSARPPVAPSNTSQPSATEAPSARESPTLEPSPEAQAPYRSIIWANYGSHATVLADKLNKRRFPGLDQDIYGRLVAGASMFISDGPVAADGMWWYQIEYNGVWGDWVAGRAEEGTPDPADDTWFISVSPPRCPADLDTGMVASLSPWALAHCASDLDSVSGVLDDCGRPHMYVSYVWEPVWASSGCPFMLWPEDDVRGSRVFSIAFTPDASLPELERGDIVELTGSFGFDTAKYGPCKVTGGGEISLETMTTVWQHACQHEFVVTGATIRGHIELERRPW